jgi:hypothetical protein
MTEEKKETISSLKAVSQTLEKLQFDLEPIRDKALDEVARLTGYSQCAEQMIKVIVSRMAAVNNQIKELEKQEELKEEEPKENIKKKKK